MYLIFDTSPIEKPKSYTAPFTDTFSWPRMIHLSWIILDKELKPVDNQNFIIEPNGFEITPEICDYVKLDAEEMSSRAIPLESALEAFDQALAQVDYVLAHNLNVNECVLAAEYIRKGIDHTLFKKERFCLMQESTHYCKLPSKTGGFKWPTLTELHAIIFSKAYSPPNNARADVIAATRCFKALMMGRQLDDLFEE
jgi:hypothetical protein